MSNRREFLKKTAASAAFAAFGGKVDGLSAKSVEVPAPKADMDVFITDASRRHQSGPTLHWIQGQPAAAATTITVDPGAKAQPILGFGGAFTDAACYVISQMPQAARATLLNELFGAKEMALSVCRICIGSSDYSRNVFSYDEGPPDPELARFSIEHDREYILPT